jgi:hypothetical protein
MRIVFSTYMKNSGSYLWLAQKLAKAFSARGIEAYWINDVINYDGANHYYDVHVYLTTFNMIEPFLKSPARRKFGHTFIIADTVMPYHPLLQLNEWQKQYDFTLLTPSIYNYLRFTKFAKVKYFPYALPVERFIPFEVRKDLFIIGANEPDYDRKGMFLAHWLKQMGFPVKALCHNLCPPGFGKPNLSNEDAEKEWDTVRWYLALSHAESPHLPLLEAYLHGVPSFYHDATEMHYLGLGVELPTGYPQIRANKMMLVWEYDYSRLWDAIYRLYTFPEDLYRKLSWTVFEFGRKWFGPSRLDDYLKLDKVDYTPTDIIHDVEKIREVVAEELKEKQIAGDNLGKL